MSHTNGLTTDVLSLFQLGATCSTMLLSGFPIEIKYGFHDLYTIVMQALQLAGIIIGIAASYTVFVDHRMKIKWKKNESRKSKPKKDDENNNHYK